MYNYRKNQHNLIDVSLFVPGLPAYEKFAEGLIEVVSIVAGFVSRLATRRPGGVK